MAASTLPAGCAVFLSFTDIVKPVGNLGEAIGQITSRAVTLEDLVGMKLQFAEGERDGVRVNGIANLYRLKAATSVTYETYALVMHGFVDKVLGEGTLARIESEVQLMHQGGLLDKKTTLHHSNVIADFEQGCDSAKGRATVLPFYKCEDLRKMRNMASVWTMQDHPLVCKQDRYIDMSTCGTQWQGGAECGECGVAWKVCVGEAARNATRDFLFAPGDVCVLGIASAQARP